MSGLLVVPEVLEESIKEVYMELFEILDNEEETDNYEADILHFEKQKANLEKRIAVCKRALQLGIPYGIFEQATQRISGEVLVIMQEKGVIEDVADKDEHPTGRVWGITN